jgi:hypothetical protein
MLIPAQNSNKANCKIQDCFGNRQIKEDVKCNSPLYIADTLSACGLVTRVRSIDYL